MSALPGALSVFLPLLVRLLRGPGKFMLAVNGALTALLVALAAAAVRDDHAAVWVPLGLGIVLAAAIVFFGVRLARLSKHVDALEKLQTESTDVEIIAKDGRPVVDDEARQRFQDASYEASLRTSRFMPRVEAAQRAAVAAAGGTVAAPYLKDDLRWTIVSGLVTAAAGPVSFVLLIVTAIIS